MRKFHGLVVGAVLGWGLLGCEPRQGAGPSLEEALADPNAWPVCISRWMEERMTHCPDLSPPPTPATCEPHAPPSMQVQELDVAPATALLVEAMRGVDKAVDRAAERLGEAMQRLGEGELDGAEPTDSEPTGAGTQGPGPEKELASARRAFERIHAQGPRRNPVWGYAAFRLGWIAARLGDHAVALARLEEAARFAADHPEAPAAKELGSAARLVLVSAQARAVSQAGAAERFARAVGPTGGSIAIDMERSLGSELMALGKLDGAARVWSSLADRLGDEGCLEDAQTVATELRKGDQDAAARALDGLLERYHALPPQSTRKAECGAVTAHWLTELGQSWYREALGVDGKSGTRDRHTMYLASQVYLALLTGFTQDALGRWGICTSFVDLSYARADLLFAQAAWDACGPAYDIALAADPRGQRGEDAAFSSVVCRQQAWTERGRALRGMGAMQRMEEQIAHTEDWRMLLRASHRYLCVAAASHHDSPAYADNAYARAQTFFDGGALWEAAIAFRLLAFDEPSSPAGAVAARRYAEVMEPLAEDDACRHELTLDLERLSTRYCNPQAPGSEACTGLGRILGELKGQRLQL